MINTPERQETKYCEATQPIPFEVYMDALTRKVNTRHSRLSIFSIRATEGRYEHSTCFSMSSTLFFRSAFACSASSEEIRTLSIASDALFDAARDTSLASNSSPSSLDLSSCGKSREGTRERAVLALSVAEVG